ncbi:MAG TPA: PLP-dependent aminotransferase family protein [Spirochaetia bacterium]|nr:PLP-dependent aminotransferase family protein [Spirochaetia bacterium]
MLRFSRRMSTAHRSFVREILKVTEDPSIISFAGGLPNPRFFPLEELSRATEKTMAESGAAALQYSTTEGFKPLRQYIANRYARRGVKVDADDILITNGSQQGLDLVAKALLDKGDVVLVERPTYLAAIQAFGLFEPRFRPLELSEDGVDPALVAAGLKEENPKLLYAIPTFQNPSGISWSTEKRRAAAALIAASDTVLVEDDPYSELRFAGQPVPPMCLEPGTSELAPWAVLLGTFSKTVAPGMRLGWLCAGHEIMERVIIAKQAADLQSNGFAQLVVHRYLMDSDVEAHIARIRAAYGRQRDLMVHLYEKLFPPEVRCTKPEGGMFLWMTLPDGMSSMELLELAIKEKVAFVPGQAFYTDGCGANTMRLNFSNADEPMIEEGMRRLARVFADARLLKRAS